MVTEALDNAGTLGARAPGTPPMVYSGGQLMTQGANVYYVWYGTWAGDPAVPILEDLARNIGGSSYLDILTTYQDKAGTPVVNSVALDGEVFVPPGDPNFSKTTLQLSDLGVIVDALISSNRLPTDQNGIYFVLTGPDITVQYDYGVLCGEHTQSTIAKVKVGYVGNGRLMNKCMFQPADAPNGDGAGDLMASVFAHELAETMTDPFPTSGWSDIHQQELADRCGYWLGTYQTSGGKTADLHLGNRDYYIQSLWLNGPNGMCAMSRSAATLACTNGAQDGVETDVDCGGGACPPCVLNQHCATNSDCATGQGVCSSGTCQYVCIADGTTDGTESGVDCGSTCAAHQVPGTGLCGPGKICASDGDCLSGWCAGNICRCANASDCPAGQGCSDGFCKCATTADCPAGEMCSSPFCVTNPCFDGTRDNLETDVDCGGGTCATCGVGKACVQDADCTTLTCRANVCRCTSNADCSTGQACLLGRCIMTCPDGKIDGFETDVDCGGPVCSPCGVGKACVQATDCTTETCLSNVCTPATCTDGVKDGNESDVDCGGSCPPCRVTNPCFDGTRDNLETDVDCGGGTCATCGVGKACVQDTDCTTQTCRANVCRCTSNANCSTGQACLLGRCIMTCPDGKMDGFETDIDCGGPVCTPCGVGKACAQATDCTTQTCLSNVCAPAP
jgi:hypothetical protein